MQIQAEFREHNPKSPFDPLFWILLGVILFLLSSFIINKARAEDFSQYTNEQIVEAIGKAENSIKYPYGIKSIDTKGNKEYARQICLNSVKNGRERWIKAGKPYDLIIYISLRFCPLKAHPLNSYWVKNVKAILERSKYGK